MYLEVMYDDDRMLACT